MTEGGRTGEVVAYWLSKAEEALASARSERAQARYDFAVNRAYYAAFYGASAALLGRGKRFVKHTGLRGAIHRDLVKAGLLAAKWGRIFDRLFEARQRADYLELAAFETEEVEALITGAAGFVEQMRTLADEHVTGSGPNI